MSIGKYKSHRGLYMVANIIKQSELNIEFTSLYLKFLAVTILQPVFSFVL